MNDETVIVGLKAWRAYRLKTFGVKEDIFRDGKPFEILARDGIRSYLVTQNGSGYWIPAQFVHFNGHAQ